MTNFSTQPQVNFKVTPKAQSVESLVLNDSHIAQRQTELVKRITETESKVTQVDLILDAITGTGQNAIKYVCKIRLLSESTGGYVKEVEGIKPVELVVSVINEAMDYIMDTKDRAKHILPQKHNQLSEEIEIV